MKITGLLLNFSFLCLSVFAQGTYSDNKIPEKNRHMPEELTTNILSQSIDRAPVRQGALPEDIKPLAFRGGTSGFAWNVFADNTGVPTGPVTVNLAEGTIASIAEVNTQSVWMIGGDFVDDTWYAVAYHPSNAALFIVDPANGDMEFLGAMGESITGLAYNVTNNIMYASGVVDDKSYLFTVDINTGEISNIGLIIPGLIIGIAADNDGNLFGINLSDNSLYAINPSTGEGTLIGDLGVAINFAQDIAYDRNNEVLYGTLYEEVLEIGGFYEINTHTGYATLIHHFVAELAGFGIPYSLAHEDAPGPVSNFSVAPGEGGILQANLSWENPAVTYGGEVLTQLSSIVVEKSGEVIHSVSDPEIGGSETFVDMNVPDNGIYTYLVYGVNDQGQGPKISYTLFVGNDVPGAPVNLTLTPINDDGFLSWEHPCEGLNGGYCGQDITYTITRMPDSVIVVENLADTEFLDTDIPGMGTYYYQITSQNSEGVGGTANSNYALLASGNYLMYEDFNYPAGQLPPGWVLQGTQHSWSVSYSALAGGQAPELMLSYSHAMGPSRLISNPVTVEGHQNLHLSFKQYLINYEAENGEVIGVDVTTDNGESWITVWEKEIEMTNIHQGEYHYYFSVPSGTSEIQLAFRFDGYSYLINQWFIDDLTLRPAHTNDMAAVSIAGSALPVKDSESTYIIEVLNAGQLSQNDYAVKLMMEGDIELAVVEGESLNFGETAFYELSWTPQEEHVGEAYIYGMVVLENDENFTNQQTKELKVYVQTSNMMTVQIGDGEVPLKSQPYDFFNHQSLSQTLYYPHEIGVNGGVIAGVLYTNNFDEYAHDIQIQIWMGETQLDQMTDTWIDPASLQQVFQGTVTFPKGVNQIFIPLDDVYMYGGSNLVVYSHKADDEKISWRAFHNTQDAGTWRSRNAQIDNSAFDPLNPPQFGYNTQMYPNITLLFSTDLIGTLQGTVLTNDMPLEDVHVQIVGANSSATTDANGFFQFDAIQTGQYELEFSKHGYYDLVMDEVVVEEGETTQVEATMDPLPVYTLTGKIVGSDNPEAGIPGASVTLKGYDQYHVTTNESGVFHLTDVYAASDYSLSIWANGFYKHQESIDVHESLDLGTILITEIAFPVSGVWAEEDPHGTLITWNAPAESLLKLYQHDGKVPEDPNAFFQQSNTIYGTVFNLSSYPDAKVSLLDFHHMQWGVQSEEYEYKVHIVDWVNLEVLSTIGPITTQVNDDWEQGVDLGDLCVASYDQIGVFIQPLGYLPDDAYPCITTDGTGPGGMSVVAPLNNLGAYMLNGPDEGDFVLNLWISTGYQKSGLVRAKQVIADHREIRNTRKGSFQSGISASMAHTAQVVDHASKTLLGYRVYRLMQDQENQPDEWSSLQTGLLDTAYTDILWEEQMPGLWKYAVMAEYANENFSEPRFSNTLHKQTPAKYQVTFRVDMRQHQGFDPDNDQVYMAGIFSWDPPGHDPSNQLMSVSEEDELVYELSLSLEEGNYEYKYFLNEGWDGAEWEEGEPNRTIAVIQSTTVNNVFGVSGETHISDIVDEDKIMLFPVPAQHTLYVKSMRDIIEIRLFDMMGHVVYHKYSQGSELEIDLSTLSTGFFVLQLRTSKGFVTQRIQVFR